jgi:hypothetical protein
VYHPVNGWLVCSNDYFGTNTAVFNTNTWPRITVYECYTSKTAAIFLNGHLLLDQVPFRNADAAKTNFTQFRLESGSACTSYLDNVAIRLSRPEDLTFDLDNDGKGDALEIEQYGNITTWRRLTNTVSSTGSGTINPTGTFTVISGSNVTYVVTSAEAWILGGMTNNGADVLSSLNRTSTRVWSYADNSVTADRVIQAAFVRDGIHYVPGDHTSITGALAVAAWTNDQVVVSNTAYDGSITLSNGVMLVGTNMTGSAGDTNLTINGAMTVVTGRVSTASGAFTVTGQVNVAAGGLLTISNTVVNFGGLSIGGGGLLQMVAGTVIVGNYTNSGTFTLSLVTNMVTSAGNGTINPSGTSTMISTWSNVVYTLTATNAGYVVGSLTNNSVVTNFSGTKTAIYTDPAANITNNQAITAAFVYNGIRYVPGDYMTVTGALEAALTNDQIVVSNGTYAGSITLSNGVSLIGTNMTGTAGDTNLAINGAMTVVQTGMVYSAGTPGQFTVTGMVTIPDGGVLTISNTAAVFGSLTITGHGVVHVISGLVTIGAITRSGTFDLYNVTNTISAPDGHGSIIPGTFTMLSGWSNVTYTLTANPGYVAGTLTSNGVDVTSSLSRTGLRTWTYADSNITNDRTITATFASTGILYVPDDASTITGALAMASAGEQIVVSNTAYDGSLTLSNGVILVGTNMTGSAGGTNLTINGAMTVVTGSVLTATSGSFTVTGGVTVAAGGLLVVSNGYVDVGVLTVLGGGTVQVVNATAFVANGVTFTGSFALGWTWESDFRPAALPFVDGFEQYAEGTRLDRLGYFGWGASSPGVVVTNGYAESGRAVEVPIQTVLSNVLQTTANTSVWMQCSVSEMAHIPAYDAAFLQVDSEASVMLYINTEDRLVMYNPDLNGVGGWDVCSNDVWGGNAGLLATGAWSRISVCLRYGDGTGRAAIFLNRRLLRKQIRLLNATRTYPQGLRMDSGTAGSAYLDTVNISTTVPADLTEDHNGNGILDADEIDRYGNVDSMWPSGSVFKIR